MEKSINTSAENGIIIVPADDEIVAQPCMHTSNKKNHVELLYECMEFYGITVSGDIREAISSNNGYDELLRALAASGYALVVSLSWSKSTTLWTYVPLQLGKNQIKILEDYLKNYMNASVKTIDFVSLENGKVQFETKSYKEGLTIQEFLKIICQEHKSKIKKP